MIKKMDQSEHVKVQQYANVLIVNHNQNMFSIIGLQLL